MGAEVSEKGRHEIRARLRALPARLGGVLGAGVPVKDLSALQADRPAPFQLDPDAGLVEMALLGQHATGRVAHLGA